MIEEFFEKMQLEAEVFFSELGCKDQLLESLHSGQMIFHWVTASKAEMIYQEGKVEKKVELACGDFLILPEEFPHQIKIENTPGQPEACNAEHGVGMLCATVKANQIGFNKWITALPNLVLVKSGKWNSQISALVFEEQKRLAQKGRSSVINRLAEIAFVCAMREFLEVEKDLGPYSLLASKTWAPLISKIMQSPEHPWSLEEMSSCCSMSRSLFAKKFKEESGWSPAQVVLWFRMQKAIGLLDQDLGIGEIAWQCGYESETAFIRAFVREHQVTPSQMRKSKKAKEVKKEH